ncbi:Domain of unknown function (DUF4476) [Orpheovirus IHUMI-LCC2]|uniref:DUF4476 domain-containing protein n=1 Tax=Orpheovirus IHUMI-LCC2 TaxID=2023057 RepID=A0A2I2L4U0_9VIRU|nr:Domain of unknown function (DUF4476) [Orpheovirus IHUMI-LCC2]SNW62558.1 Domain of unknown function (DUF4476) [Orpheovirus IHUMI-LCC2]
MEIVTKLCMIGRDEKKNEMLPTLLSSHSFIESEIPAIISLYGRDSEKCIAFGHITLKLKEIKAWTLLSVIALMGRDTEKVNIVRMAKEKLTYLTIDTFVSMLSSIGRDDEKVNLSGVLVNKLGDDMTAQNMKAILSTLGRDDSKVEVFNLFNSKLRDVEFEDLYENTNGCFGRTSSKDAVYERFGDEYEKVKPKNNSSGNVVSIGNIVCSGNTVSCVSSFGNLDFANLGNMGQSAGTEEAVYVDGVKWDVKELNVGASTSLTLNGCDIKVSKLGHDYYQISANKNRCMLIITGSLPAYLDTNTMSIHN